MTFIFTIVKYVIKKNWLVIDYIDIGEVMFFYSRNYIKSFKVLIVTYIFLAIQTNAEERFFVTNETLFYNSEIETSNGSFGIIFEDIDEFKMLLEQN